MVQIKPIICPRCGGDTNFQSGVISFRCERCGTRLAVSGELPVPHYYVEPKLTRLQGINAMRQIFDDPDTAAALSTSALLSSTTLIYIPLLEMHGLRVGIMTMGKQFETKVTYYVQTKDTRETSVCINDFYQALPIAVIPNLGIEELTLNISDWNKKEGLGSAKVLPANMIELKKSGYVLEPTGSIQNKIDAFEKQLQAYLPLTSGMKIIEKRYRILYYPVYLGKYLYKGCTYPIVVSAISGEVLYAIAPQKDTGRPLAALIPAFITSLIVAPILKNITTVPEFPFKDVFLMILYSSGQASIFGLIFILFMLGVFSSILSLFWVEFRYKGLVYFQKSGIKIFTKVNKPPKTKLEKISDFLLDMCDKALKNAGEE